MGWGPKYGPYVYTVWDESKVTSELARLSGSTIVDDVHCVTFQPFCDSENRSQDRYVVQSWSLSNGVWKFMAVFDGHAGHDTVDHAVEHLPSLIKSALSSVLDSHAPDAIPSAVSSLLAREIAAFDDSIGADITGLFPDGPLALSLHEIRAIINDSGENQAKILRGMCGTTVVLALIDPDRRHFWVANLGDSLAVLGAELSGSDRIAHILSSFHNGRDPAEAARIRKEHRGESDCIVQDRVLGALAVTRALGDHAMKLPDVYTRRVFLNSEVGFRTQTSPSAWIDRNLTPPYVSNAAHVEHGILPDNAGLILCSDGLIDLYGSMDMSLMPTRWAEVVGVHAERQEDNLALRLLRDALGGADLARVSRMMTVELDCSWMDDTTILVLPL